MDLVDTGLHEILSCKVLQCISSLRMQVTLQLALLWKHRIHRNSHFLNKAL